MGTVVKISATASAGCPSRSANTCETCCCRTTASPALWDYKDQLELLNKYARAGDDGKQAVLRLPACGGGPSSGAALTWPCWRTPGRAYPPPLRYPRQPPSCPLTIADKLNQKTSLFFPRNTLETSLKLLGDDLGIEIVILGGDLQQEGITKNQSFGLEERDSRPATSRQDHGAGQSGGQAGLVVKPKEGGGEETLYVTTRGSGEARRYIPPNWKPRSKPWNFSPSPAPPSRTAQGCATRRPSGRFLAARSAAAWCRCWRPKVGGRPTQRRPHRRRSSGRRAQRRTTRLGPLEGRGPRRPAASAPRARLPALRRLGRPGRNGPGTSKSNDRRLARSGGRVTLCRHGRLGS